LREHHGPDGAQKRAGHEKCCFTDHPPTFSEFDTAHHGDGSIDAPSFRNSI
jgi:hypothetical protein